MIQTIDFAPLDGITKIVFRQVWSQFFSGVDRYFIPFFSPTPHHLMTPRDGRTAVPGMQHIEILRLELRPVPSF